MLTNRGSIVFTALGTIFCFFLITYYSCTKIGKDPKCNSVVCLNNGICDTGVCVCPSGFEGTNCGTASVDKYIGPWDVTQTIVGSDSIGAVANPPRYYQMGIERSSTPTSFKLEDFIGNYYYNDIICVLDTLSSFKFYVDTNRGPNMLQDKTFIQQHCSGTIDASENNINMILYIRRINRSFNWENDTLKLVMTRHHI